MRRVATLIVAALLVTALFTPVATAAGPAAMDAPTEPAVDTLTRPDAGAETADNHSESAEEQIGCWEGICHDDELDFNQSGGLSDEQLQEMVHLEMARVEAIRDRTFKEDVPVEVLSREEYTRSMQDRESDEEFGRWNDQVWKALFIIGEDDSSEEELGSVYTGAVAGFYSPAESRVVIVVPEGEALQISPVTLVHELGHAMQDQHHNLSAPRFQGETQDADLAIDGLVEGEASYLEREYEERCDSGEWECIDAPPEEDDSSPPDLNWGILITVLQPYSDGPAYVADVVEEERWEGVDQRMENPPTTTSQVIHRTDDYETAEIEFEDTAEGNWETYPNRGRNGADTVGEASIFSMFWYQNREYGADTFDWREVLLDTSHPAEDYNYAHPTSDGWAGDELYPYRNGEKDGYVWVIEWQTEEDAQEFQKTYLRMIDAHDAVHRDDGVYDIEEGDFRGAYGIERNGTTVTIVHGPEPADVFDLRPEIDLDEPETDDAATATEADSRDDDTPTGTVTEGEIHGFGVIGALVALVAATLLRRGDQSRSTFK